MRSSSVSSLSRSSGSSQLKSLSFNETAGLPTCCSATDMGGSLDRKSTRLNSSHLVISYAVFCLKKKKKKQANAATSLHHHQQIKSVQNSYRSDEHDEPAGSYPVWHLLHAHLQQHKRDVALYAAY